MAGGSWGNCHSQFFGDAIMTTTYTIEELTKISGAVTISGMAVAVVEAGIISTAIEASAMAKEVTSAATKYPNNTVIQAILSGDAIKQLQENPSARMTIKPEELQPDVAVNTATSKIQEAMVILEGKATATEIQEYKDFLYNCCDRVANAAGSGLFGSGDPKVSNKEAAALAQIKAALN
jgi:hypothetical protein